MITKRDLFFQIEFGGSYNIQFSVAIILASVSWNATVDPVLLELACLLFLKIFSPLTRMRLS